jgi:Ca2+-binding RTX toxin-like protein
MARFNLNSFLNNDRFEDFFAQFTGGGSGHDHLNGTTSGNVLFSGGSADTIAGMAGNDTLNSGSGDDKVWGGSGNDQLSGGSGADLLVGGFGADRLDGGTGNDVLLSRADAGEMVAAQDGTTQIFADETAAFKAVNDTLTGGRGADTFRFELQVNAKDEIVARHVNDDGTIDWVGVTGENNATHDHWVDGFGNDVIRDFNRAQGDKIEISAHTAEVKSIEYKDSNGDGKNDYSVITVISQQGNAGAHDEDLLGTITVYGNLVKQSDITVTQTVYGAYEKVGELGAGVHFELEDDGVLPNGGTDGGHHNEMTAMANIMNM